eukprot:499700_1
MSIVELPEIPEIPTTTSQKIEIPVIEINDVVIGDNNDTKIVYHNSHESNQSLDDSSSDDSSSGKINPSQPTAKIAVHLCTDSIVSVSNETSTKNIPKNSNNTNELQQGKIEQNNTINALQKLDTSNHLSIFQIIMNSKYMYSRIFIILFTILLFMLSFFYAIAQILNVRLNLVVLCNEPKTNDEIWQYNSKRNSLKAQIQGLPQDPCMTSRSIYIDEGRLWNTNSYLHEWTPINIRFVAFICLCIYCLVIIIFALYTLITDTMLMKRHLLHTKSRKYSSYMIHNSAATTNKNTKKKNTLKKGMEIFGSNILSFVNKFKVDTGYWVVLTFLYEIFEFSLQSINLSIYNGYNLFDPDHTRDIYLATKPIFIKIFSIFIMFNCFSSGIVWIFYVFRAKTCHGYTFKMFIFFVDQLSDLLYSIYPFIIIMADTFNTNNDNLNVLLGQLTLSSGLQFFAAFVPLFVLCNKCFILVRSSWHEMCDQVCYEWIFQQRLAKSTDQSDTAKTQAAVQGFNISGTNLQMNGGEIYDCNGNFVMKYSKNQTAIISEQNWINKSKKTKTVLFRKILISGISILYFIYGMMISILIFNFFIQSEQYCNMIVESKYAPYFNQSLSVNEKNMFKKSPELFVWEYCNYPVYPFSNAYDNPCNCRVFDIDWWHMLSTEQQRSNQYNVTQDEIVNSLLKNWFMLEKFKTSHDSTGVIYELKSLPAIKMKAFEWQHAKLSYISEQLSKWELLEYFKLEETLLLEKLPIGFNKLKSMKLINFAETGLIEFEEQICELKELKVLHFAFEANLVTLPKCVEQLDNLMQFIIDNSILLAYIPIGVFQLKQIREFSLFNSDISYKNILSYNNISDLESFEFKWNNHPNIKFFMTSSPFCDQDDFNSMQS